jgi:hypothetical protein
MPGACPTCIHFRRARLASQVLASLFNTNTEGAEIAQALSKVSEDEHKLREAEAETKSREGLAGRDLWAARPMTSDFCGFEEEREIYRIAEVKNRGLGCTDYAAGKPERHACADCAHRIPAEGRQQDIRMEAVYANLMNTAIAAQGSDETSKGLLQGYRSAEASKKALEISATYESKGRLVTKPKYLDHCAKFSSPDEFVVCVLQNPHHTCAAWTPAPDQPSTNREEVA